jgi:hypothetical protein
MNKAMKKFIKSLTVGCAVLLIAASLTACSSSKEETTANIAEEKTANVAEEKPVDKAAEEKPADNTRAEKSAATVFGKVTKVEGNNITLALGELPEMGNGEAPAGKSEGEVPAEKPEGEAPAGKPEGEAPAGKPEGMDSNQMPEFIESGEEATITIEDESLIQLKSGRDESEQGSIEDITVDSMVSIEYDGNENIVSINVQLIK